MTEALPLATQNAADQRPPIPTSELPSFPQTEPPAAFVTEETADDDDGEIACICAYTSDDGSTVQCDKCLRWQHISCYYPPPKKVPDDDQKHYCVDCVPQPDLDPRKAADRQRRALEQHNGVNGVKRPATKASKKKSKDSPSLTAQTNGWPDRHPHIYHHDRKSASPRDQPPPAKKPKISHRSTGSMSNASGRKRASTTQAPPGRSPSKSPEINTNVFIPQYSEEFLHLFRPQSEQEQVDTDTNLMDNISVSFQLSDWLSNPEALSKATGGLAPSEIFKRWDGNVEDIPGRPDVSVQFVEDPSFESEGITPRWAQLIIENEVTKGAFIGELRGRIGHKQDYVHDTESRWSLLHHPEPFVFFHPQLPICIDARQEGTRFRYVRRSCQPNAELQTIITAGVEYHFCFMATRDIRAGEEVTVAWQVPDSIRERINSSLKTSNNFQPKVREYISTWISNVLANCGPCACNTHNGCLMAHYDRRGLSPPAPAIKSAKRKRRVPMLDTAVADRSRSTSEVRKAEQDEDGSASRSASGSQASASRDITPNTHYSGNTSTKGMPELSERERKKLMREEEMFRRQEAESGKPKKKQRNSSGSALNTPSATTSRPLALPPNGPPSSAAAARYTDAGTSSGRPSITSRGSGGKRKTAPSSRQLRKEVSIATKAAPSYVDASVQCDLEPSNDLHRLPTRPRKRYISVTQRLLARCINNNVPRLAEKAGATTMGSDVMDVDEAIPPKVASSLPVKEKSDEVHGEEPLVRRRTAEDADTAMTDVEAPVAVKSESPSAMVKQRTPMSPPPSSSPRANDNASGIVPRLSAEPPVPPWSKEVSPFSAPVAVGNSTNGPHHKPVMHLEMPPPPSSTSLSAAATAYAHSQAAPGPLLTGTPLSSTPLPLFSPSVTASVLMSPSPVRKKMSLSDYTKRNKAARETSGGIEVATPLVTPAAGSKSAAPWSIADRKEDVAGGALADDKDEKVKVEDGPAAQPDLLLNGTSASPEASPSLPAAVGQAPVANMNGSTITDLPTDREQSKEADPTASTDAAMQDVASTAADALVVAATAAAAPPTVEAPVTNPVHAQGIV